MEDVLVGCGLAEAYTSSLVADDPRADALRLPVPLSAEQAILRTTLVGGLVEAARHNVDAGNEGIRLFELARVYLPAAAPRPEERWHAGGIVEGGYFAAKGVVEALYAALKVEPLVERGQLVFLHPGKAARLPAGWLGELHPSLLEGEWGAFELDLPTLFAEVPARVEYDDVITYPAVRQDLALVVDEEVLAGELVSAARAAAGPDLREVRVFDVYRGEPIPAGRKSVALHVAFQSPDRTLSDDDARVLRERVVAALAERFGAELRA
jgi:phenylalanyl-tRNA synthetase beta chain